MTNDALAPEPEVGSRWLRWAGISGLLWFATFAVGGIILQGEPPAYDAPIAEIRDFFRDEGQRYLVGDYIVNIAFVFFFLPLVVVLRSLLGAAEGGAQIASRLVLVGGLATVLVGGGATAFLDTIALGAGGPGLDDSTFRALLYADAVAIAALGVPVALFTVATSIVIWTRDVLWRWLAVLGTTDGLLLLIGAAFPIEQAGPGVLFAVRFASFLGFAIFVVLMSVSMLLNNRRKLAG